MCGICGIAFSDRERPADQDVIARMTATLHHRGPDGRGYHSSPGVGLGMTRLSIVDLETGDQPISSEDGAITVVCNGEIYNHAQLRNSLIARGHRFRTHSDVEVIVHLYEDFGVECVQHLRGMFGFALWDGHRRRLMLARDRLGIKPLHYSIAADGCYFGSEQKAILASDAVERRLDVSSLAELMTQGVVRTPRTLFSSIRRLPPGHYLLYEQGKESLHEYWDVDFTPDRTVRSAGEWAEALREQLTESVRLHLMSDVPVGAWLSAGLDSSSIVALMNRLGQRAIPTFTLAFEHPDFDEVGTQKLLYDFPGYDLDVHKATCGDEHIGLLPKVVWHTEDPVAGGVEIPRMLLSRAAAQKVKVVLTGEGSDELLGGYEFFRLDKILRPLARLPHGVRKVASALAGSRHPRASQVAIAPGEVRMNRYLKLTGPLGNNSNLLSSDVLDRTGPAVDHEDIVLPEAFSTWDTFSQLQYYEMKIRLPDRIESVVDRASMAYSVEARVPFLDHVFVEFCATIPSAVKMRWMTEKQVLRDAMRDVLPRELARRKKRGMAAPLRHWMKSPLPDFAQDLLSDSALGRTGYFDPAAVAQLRERAGHERVSRSAGKLMSVLMVQLWDELFIQRREPGSGFPL
jgi:asparagine synthase (glutamine-hydrolysing)